MANWAWLVPERALLLAGQWAAAMAQWLVVTKVKVLIWPSDSALDIMLDSQLVS